MLLHQQFVRTAKQFEDKLAIVDRTTDKRLTYKKALIGAFILAKKLDVHRKGFIGILLPNSEKLLEIIFLGMDGLGLTNGLKPC